MDAVSLEIFKGLLSSVAEEMGAALGRSGFSANIKERRDYSCAVFDPEGRLTAQAAHLPVHLGSMPASVSAAMSALTLEPGDVAILNDPYLGGTHLPDITLVAPVHTPGGELAGYVANRAHHADVGGASPGSMPLATELIEEGLIIPPVKLVEEGVRNEGVFELICRNVRTPDERRGDLAAQAACIGLGSERLLEIVDAYGLDTVHEHMAELLRYSERLTRAAIEGIPDGDYRFEDVLDGDGFTGAPITIAVTITVQWRASLTADFTGSSPEVRGPVNAVESVTSSALLYVLLCVAGGCIPPNQGSLGRRAPDRAAGERRRGALTPRRLGGQRRDLPAHRRRALRRAGAGRPRPRPGGEPGHHEQPGLRRLRRHPRPPFAYYETIGGGMGGRHGLDGLSAVQTHMTNTLNTPVEAMEFDMPLRVREYAIRRNSGGRGAARGGDGIRRAIEFLAPARLSVISDRRSSRPYGLAGGQPGAPGRNTLRRASGETEALPSKAQVDVGPGDALTVETPGGGGHGAPGGG